MERSSEQRFKAESAADEVMRHTAAELGLPWQERRVVKVGRPTRHLLLEQVVRRAIREDKWRFKTPRDVPLVSCGLFTSAEEALQMVVDETSAFLETEPHDTDAATVPHDGVPRPLGQSRLASHHSASCSGWFFFFFEASSNDAEVSNDLCSVSRSNWCVTHVADTKNFVRLEVVRRIRA